MAPALCARGGCTREADGKYCSRRCAALARLCAGWKPQAVLMRPDVRARACRKGALAVAKIWRRRRAQAIQARLLPLLQSAVFQGAEPELKAAAAALLGKAYRLGKADGYQRGYKAKDTPRLKRQQKGKAA